MLAITPAKSGQQQQQDDHDAARRCAALSLRKRAQKIWRGLRPSTDVVTTAGLDRARDGAHAGPTLAR